ncbi:MAG: sugar ABC transporter substrate-binding protein [Clostridiales bacterium]|jgi:multiple sugar transport system substrate-binding protein|nr:sugar ABC transporter substrate-binding protein [Clostridiales bacterium]
MKKFLSAPVAMLLAVSILAGCAGSTPVTTSEPAAATDTPATDTPATADTPVAEAEPVTLKWALWDLEVTDYYRAIMDGYKKVAPHVTIEPVDLGSADYMNMLQTQLSGNADFDVVAIKDIPGYANLIAQNQLEPLNDYVNSAGIDTDLFGGITEQVTVDNELYQLPFRSDFWVIFYNKDLYDAVGVEYPSNDLTIEDYDALARKLVNGEGNDKVYGAHYHTWRSCVQLFGILDGLHSIVDGTYDWIAPYYEMILAQQKDGVVMDYATAVSTSSHYRDLFFNAKIAMMNNGTWMIASNITASADGTSLATNWGMVKYPHPAGTEPGTTFGTITGVSIAANSKNKDEAFKFIEWTSGPEGATALAAIGAIPAIQTEEIMSAIANAPGFPTDQNSIDALQTAKIYLEMPLHEKSGEIDVALNEEHSEIMNGSKTIEDGLAAMNRRVGEILQ